MGLPKAPAVPPAQKPVVASKAPVGPNLVQWQAQALHITEHWHQLLLKRQDILDWLEQERFLAEPTIRRWKLGYQPFVTQAKPVDWGFCSGEKPIWFSPSISIPHLRPDGSISGINMRLFKETDNLPKGLSPKESTLPPYLRIRGSKSLPWVLAGSLPITGPILVVESELDALLLWQYLDLYVTPVALLTAAAKPEPGSLPPGPVLFALDSDAAGSGRFPWWKKHYQALPAPPIKGKDITDMVRNGVDLIAWLNHILKSHGLMRPNVLNPYAHFSLLTGPVAPVQGTLPTHIWREGTAPGGIIASWLQAEDDPVARHQLEIQYQRLWGLHP